jgi:hypothetical protein
MRIVSYRASFPSAVDGGKNSNEKQGLVAAMISSMRTDAGW